MVGMSETSTPTPVRTNALAIVSLVSGIVGLTFIPFVGSIVAVITGHMARKEIRSTGDAGDGLAKGGLITGYIGLGLSVLGIIIFIIAMVIIAASGAMMYNY